MPSIRVAVGSAEPPRLATCLARSFAPHLSDGSAMLAVLSTTVREPIPGLGASNVLRPGIAMLVKELLIDLAPRVRVNGILPGRIDTGRRRVGGAAPLGDLERTRALDADDPAARRHREASIPLGRYGDPVEFGRVAAFLLSPAASYVTGALVPVDGGILHSPW